LFHGTLPLGRRLPPHEAARPWVRPWVRAPKLFYVRLSRSARTRRAFTTRSMSPFQRWGLGSAAAGSLHVGRRWAAVVYGHRWCFACCCTHVSL
jgi:hypothetical protein